MRIPTLIPIKLEDIDYSTKFCYFEDGEWFNCVLDEHDDEGEKKKVVWIGAGLADLDELPERLFVTKDS